MTAGARGRALPATATALALGAALLAVASAGCGDDGGSAGDDAGAVLDGGAGGDAQAGDGGAGGDGAVTPSGPGDLLAVRYPAGALHSPLSAEVVARAGAVLAGSTGRRDVFAKVGASNTVSAGFFHCYSGSDVMWGASAALQPTRDHFLRTLADGSVDSFERNSLAATVGWQASDALQGNPTPLAQEIAAIRPAFAIVLFGTNDSFAAGVAPFERSLTGVVDTLLGAGVFPIVSTIPPRGDSASADAIAREINAIVRLVAARRAVPLVDLWQRLTPLPGYGLIGDGIHLASFSQGGSHPCWLTPAALMEGMNQRNLVTLEAFDRLRRVLDGGAVEAAAPRLAGRGTWSDPYVIDAAALPFGDAGDSARSMTSEVGRYACGAQDEGGAEVVYRVRLSSATTLRARVFTDDGVDVDLHWLDAPRADGCVARADKLLDVTAAAGDHWLVVDSFVSGGVARAGGYRLTLLETP